MLHRVRRANLANTKQVLFKYLVIIVAMVSIVTKVQQLSVKIVLKENFLPVACLAVVSVIKDNIKTV